MSYGDVLSYVAILGGTTIMVAAALGMRRQLHANRPTALDEVVLVVDRVVPVQYRLIRPDDNLIWAYWCAPAGASQMFLLDGKIWIGDNWVCPPWRYERRECDGTWTMLAERAA